MAGGSVETKAAPVAEPWAMTHRWTDTVEGTTPAETYAEAFHAWVEANHGSYNQQMYLCNWWPIRMLVEYAAAKGLRVRLKYWPGRASTAEGGKREWDTTKVYTHDSHGGRFATKDAFYRRVRSTVTARMIGTLNTVAVAEADARPGDFLTYPYGDSYWHCKLLVRKTDDGKFVTQDGSTPAQVPSENEDTFDTFPPATSGSTKPRSVGWNFAQFDPAVTPRPVEAAPSPTPPTAPRVP